MEMVKTTEELRNPEIVSDEQLLQYFDNAQGHTKEFQQFFDVDYSYTMLRTVLEERGFVDGWHRPVDKQKEEKEVFQITIQRQGGNGSLNLTMTNDCKERYKQFTDENGDAFVHTTAALMLYMDLCESGRLEVLSSHIAPKKGKKRSAN